MKVCDKTRTSQQSTADSFLPQSIPNMPSEHQQVTMNSTQSEAQSFFNKGQGTLTSIEPEERSFLDAMVKLYKDEESTDAYLVCQGIRKPVHIAVLVAR